MRKRGHGEQSVGAKGRAWVVVCVRNFWNCCLQLKAAGPATWTENRIKMYTIIKLKLIRKNVLF